MKIFNFSFSQIQQKIQLIFPGFLIAVLVALAGQFISDHYQVPVMLMVLLFGMVLNFLSENNNRCYEGINFAAKKVLKFGVALLGMRISFDLALQLGSDVLLLVVLGLCLTIFFGLAIGKFLKQSPSFSFLTAGSVAICGASAAMAISAILPKDPYLEKRLTFTVVGVTLLSTIAMIFYPIIAISIGFDETQIGIFLGATIHDVAQVVGAGFSISQSTGEVATVIKLIRVSVLAPVILIASLVLRKYIKLNPEEIGSRPPLIPFFIIVFIILMTLNSLHLVHQSIIDLSSNLSRWALLIAIAAVGLKTSIKDFFVVGIQSIIPIVANTIFIALFVIIALLWQGT